MATKQIKRSARDKLLDAALKIIRAKGYSATRVEEICAEAGVTKGAFFHHFRNKEDWGVAAAQHWSGMTGALFEGAPYHRHDDPFDRLIGYVEFRKAIIEGDVEEFTCLVGTMTQEIYGSHPELREACAASIFGHAATLVPDIEAAMAARGLEPGWTAASLAAHTQAVLQGAFILAKATGDRDTARDSVDHLRRYIELLFAADSKAEPTG
ncbi:TetR/AcrR family transcriptional regulator [Oceaniglobus trochenteri]|uniref:TetR/AcrR family transcriptional regulator n=1 Tax=Oceaniglobus trochenteri TaxID=2763260 RepID=UPI001CFF8A0C|nr:TetR/AcrR family transcriptional regulator [Oceaniglobus trochenteri]